MEELGTDGIHMYSQLLRRRRSKDLYSRPTQAKSSKTPFQSIIWVWWRTPVIATMRKAISRKTVVSG
jgi:hypothetical protein